jgi:hypothetical protein
MISPATRAQFEQLLLSALQEGLPAPWRGLALLRPCCPLPPSAAACMCWFTTACSPGCTGSSARPKVKSLGRPCR